MSTTKRRISTLSGSAPKQIKTNKSVINTYLDYAYGKPVCRDINYTDVAYTLDGNEVNLTMSGDVLKKQPKTLPDGTEGTVDVYKSKNHEFVLKKYKKNIDVRDLLRLSMIMSDEKAKKLFISFGTFDDGKYQLMEKAKADVFEYQRVLDNEELSTFNARFNVFCCDVLEFLLDKNWVYPDFKTENVAYFDCNGTPEFRVIDTTSLFSVHKIPKRGYAVTENLIMPLPGNIGKNWYWDHSFSYDKRFVVCQTIYCIAKSMGETATLSQEQIDEFADETLMTVVFDYLQYKVSEPDFKTDVKTRFAKVRESCQNYLMKI